MKTKKILSYLVLAVVTTCILTGCNTNNTKSTEDANNSEIVSESNKTDKTENKDTKEVKEVKDIKNTKDTITTKTENNKISVVYPSNWTKKTISGIDAYLLDNKGTNVNLVTENMQGLSKEQYDKASDIDVKTNLGVDKIVIKESEFNHNKARITNFIQKYKDVGILTYQVTFYNDDTSYIFTLGGLGTISDENLNSFINMLNTVSFKN